MLFDNWIEKTFKAGPDEKRKAITYIIRKWLDMYVCTPDTELIKIMVRFNTLSDAVFDNIPRDSEDGIGGKLRFNIPDLEFYLVLIIWSSAEDKASKDLLLMINEIRTTKTFYQHLGLDFI